MFPTLPGSLCNSSGLYLGQALSQELCRDLGRDLGQDVGCDLGFDVTRPGIALYGGNPTPGKPNPMERTISLEARVVQVRSALLGETVGYGATWTCRRPSRLAVLDIGYADGLFRSTSGSDAAPGGEVVIRGRRCPVVGRISMDLTVVDITELADSPVHRGDWAEVIGAHIDLDEVASRAGTISYEVLTRLGHRFHRRLLES